MVCVQTPVCSIMLNGAPTGFFGAQRGLRKGDPMSPLLFALCINYLDRILFYIGDMEGFKFHSKCNTLKLIHLCFADDLLLFCHGEFKSIYIMLQGFSCFLMHLDLKSMLINLKLILLA